LAVERLAVERLAVERLAVERLAVERLAAERLAVERLAAERLAVERVAVRADRLFSEERLPADRGPDRFVAMPSIVARSMPSAPFAAPSGRSCRRQRLPEAAVVSEPANPRTREPANPSTSEPPPTPSGWDGRPRQVTVPQQPR
jgi:hypothetical protein